MSFRCDAASDCGCQYWNRGYAGAFCLASSCEHLVQTYNIKKCGCGAAVLPALFGEGQARQYLKEKNEPAAIIWSELTGYVAECPSCRMRTTYCSTPEEAVNGCAVNTLPLGMGIYGAPGK